MEFLKSEIEIRVHFEIREFENIFHLKKKKKSVLFMSYNNLKNLNFLSLLFTIKKKWVYIFKFKAAHSKYIFANIWYLYIMLLFKKNIFSILLKINIYLFSQLFLFSSFQPQNLFRLRISWILLFKHLGFQMHKCQNAILFSFLVFFFSKTFSSWKIWYPFQTF